MAGVAGGAAVSFLEQVKLIAWLRWRLLRNSLRSTQQKLTLAAGILVGIIGALVVAALTLVVFQVSRLAVTQGRAPLLTIVFWGIFLVWHIFPLLVSVARAEFDFANLLRFPLLFRTFFLLYLAYGLVDLAAITGLVFLGAMVAGIAGVQISLLPWALLVALLFAAANLLISRATTSWLEKLLAKRKMRERLVVVFIAAMLLFQFAGVFLEQYGAQLKAIRDALRPVLTPLLAGLPPGAAGHGLVAILSGKPDIAAFWLLLLAAYGVGFGWMLHRRVLMQYRGEDLSETLAPAAPAAVASLPATPAASRASSAAAAAPGSAFLSGSAADWVGRLIVLRDPLAALLEREIRYFFRNGMLVLNAVIPLILPLFFMSISDKRPDKGLEKLATLDLWFPAMIGYATLIISAHNFNSFAYDHRGAQTFFTAPIRLRDALLAKNLFAGSILLTEALLLWGLFAVMGRAPGPASFVSSMLALGFLFLLNASVGNLVSVMFPRPFAFGQMRRTLPGMAVLATLVTQLVAMALSGGVYWYAAVQKNLWIAAGGFAGLFAIFIPSYNLLLDAAQDVALRRREKMLGELCKL